MVEPYWPPSEPKAAAVAASISGLSSFMIWGGRSRIKSHHSHLVNEVASLASGFTDGLVDCGAGLLWDVSALLLVLGGTLLLLDSGARLPRGRSANVLHNLLAHLLRPGLKFIFQLAMSYLRGVVHSLTLTLVDDSAFPFLNSGALNIVHCFADFLLHNIALLFVRRVALL